MEEVQCISQYDPQFKKIKSKKAPPVLCVLWPLWNMQKPAVSYIDLISFFNNEPRKTLLSQLTIVMRMAFLPPIPASTSSLLMNPSSPTLATYWFFHVPRESMPSLSRAKQGSCDAGSNGWSSLDFEKALVIPLPILYPTTFLRLSSFPL